MPKNPAERLCSAPRFSYFNVLVRGVVQGRIAGAVGEHRHVPVRRDHVHVGGAGFELETRAAPLRANRSLHRWGLL